MVTNEFSIGLLRDVFAAHEEDNSDFTMSMMAELGDRMTVLKKQVKDMISTTYGEFNRVPREARRMKSSLKKIYEHVELLDAKMKTKAVPNLKNSISVMTGLSKCIAEISLKGKIVDELVQLNTMFVDAQDYQKDKKYFVAMKSFELLYLKLEKASDDVKQLKIYPAIIEETARSRVYLQDLMTNTLLECFKYQVTTGIDASKISYYTLKVDRNRKEDFEESFQALHYLNKLEPFFVEFASWLKDNLLLTIILHCCSVTVDNKGGKYVVLKVEADFTLPKSKFTKVYENLMVVLTFLNTYLSVKVSENATMMNELGKLTSNDFCSALISHCLADTIPSHSNLLDEYKVVISATEDFHNNLKAIGFLDGSNSTLTDYTTNAENLCATKTSMLLLVRAREIILKDLYDVMEIEIVPEARVKPVKKEVLLKEDKIPVEETSLELVETPTEVELDKSMLADMEKMEQKLVKCKLGDDAFQTLQDLENNSHLKEDKDRKQSPKKQESRKVITPLKEAWEQVPCALKENSKQIGSPLKEDSKQIGSPLKEDSKQESPIEEDLKQMGSPIKEVSKQMGSPIKEDSKQMGSPIKEDSKQMGIPIKEDSKQMGNPIKEDSKQLGSPIKEDSKQMGSPIKEDSKQLGSPIKEDSKQMGNPIKEDSKQMGSPIKEDSKQMGSPIKEDSKQMGSPIKEDSKQLGSPIKEDSKQMGSPIKEVSKQIESPLREDSRQIVHPLKGNSEDNQSVTTVDSQQKQSPVKGDMTGLKRVSSSPQKESSLKEDFGRSLKDDFDPEVHRAFLYRESPARKDLEQTLDSANRHTLIHEDGISATGEPSPLGKNETEPTSFLDVNDSSQDPNLSQLDLSKEGDDASEVKPLPGTNEDTLDEFTEEESLLEALHYSANLETVINKNETNFNLSGAIFSFPKCHISKSANELIILLNEVLNDCIGTSNKCAINLFKTARKIVEMYCAIAPIYHSKYLKTFPQQAAVFHNNCLYIAHCLLTLGHMQRILLPEGAQAIGSFGDQVTVVRMLGSSAFLAHLHIQRSQILEIIRDCGLSTLRECSTLTPDTERALRQCVRQLEKLKTVWQPVLPVNVYINSMACLMNSFLDELINRVITVQDIPAETASQLVDMFGVVITRIKAIFPDPNIVEEFSNWEMFQELVLILGANLNFIKDRWSNGHGPSALHFTPEQMRQLIRALFQNTERRSALLAEIRN